ncbi:homocysteine S-methyltransferase family protein [Prevotella sp. KH2C16]|uniref:homocysteine S-methyltransferase family protein n=1 Tax=Prevotella sp. KH2C16 TaxID=1855325 RepID=UPI0008EEF550|nr:homocysteine S-methyltransferase family protein [Prevotella sp. KH2C16]SFG41093.1 5-methyltetrahydrofolate--homocysteine methyltransferase [Prevotella sp. KH2C16]
MTTRNEILQRMKERILILDGAAGTYLRHLNLGEEDFRGERLGHHPVSLKGCCDVLCLTRPDIVRQMHEAYIDAGADIVETNSFNANRLSLADYGLEDLAYEISRAAAAVAREACGRRADRRVWVAGSMGPTNRRVSASPHGDGKDGSGVSLGQLRAAYYDQARGLVDGGADLILVETLCDLLHAEAALKAVGDLAETLGHEIPVMCSATLDAVSGRMPWGPSVEEYCAALAPAGLLAIGLNCGCGARQLLPWIRRLSRMAGCPVSVHPSAGLPNVSGGYDETPEGFAAVARQAFEERLVNIYGGCCGTTPEHIRAVARLAGQYRPREIGEE